MTFRNNQKGLTTFEIILLTPLILFFVFCLLTMLEKGFITLVTNNAAREAHRIYSVTHNYTQAKDKAVDKVTKVLPGDWSFSDSTRPSETFKPNGPNSKHDNLPDVYLRDDSTNCVVRVRYHMVVPAPGMAKLVNAESDWLDKYAMIESVVKGHREIDLP